MLSVIRWFNLYFFKKLFERKAFSVILIGTSFVLASCFSEDPSPKEPTLSAELVSSNNNKRGISFAQVLNIAKNSSEMSCIELTLGSLQAHALTIVANPKVVKASDKTRAISGSVGKSASAKIDKELQCHCDRGVAMPGYEIFERRVHLQKNKYNRTLNLSLVNFYPKNSSGQPRFLEPGEKLSKAVLKQLPPPHKTEGFDDCGRSCKAARKRTNAKARAAGKPEPYPNLQHPRKKACR